MKTLDKILSFFEYWMNGALILVMSLVIFTQIVFRHLGLPLDWTEETARFMFIWLIYIAVSQAAKEHRHLSVDILPLMLGPRGQSAIRIISNILCMLFFAVIFYYGLQVMNRLYIRPQRSQAMQLNMLWAYAAPFFGSLVTTLRYLVMAFNSEYNTEKEIDFISLARQFNFAGLILITAQAGDLHQKLRELDMPVVLVNRTFDDFVGNFVSIDNFQAGYLATKHLVELGHTRLGFVSGHFTSSSVQQRLNGFMQVVKNYNLKFDEKKHFFVGDLKLETGRTIAGQFVPQLEDMPSGVVICNDMMSIGFIDYCREMGVRVPEMLSVVGFDNIAISALHDISLTTVDQRVEEMCIRAAELILRRIENPSAPLERVMIDPTLVVRKTTAPFREDRLANYGEAGNLL